MEENTNNHGFITTCAEGDILTKQGDYRKAVEAYSQALEITKDEVCYTSRGRNHLHLGNPEAALEDAEAALKEDKKFIFFIESDLLLHSHCIVQNPGPMEPLSNHVVVVVVTAAVAIAPLFDSSFSDACFGF
eukprot:Clim_evm8s8 gene=Clim_evmTU8s8